MNKPAFITLIVIVSTATLHAWWGGGHQILARASVKALQSSMPAFFTSSALIIAQHSLDPDAVKNPAVPYVKYTEGPEHFFDMELWGDSLPPSSRYHFISACCRLGKTPDRIGFLPFAIQEWTGRLAIAFAEYRKWPGSTAAQNACLLYAGYLAHYASDACQPLHVTVHFDGKVRADGKSPRSGIHDKVDALIENTCPADSLLISGTGDTVFSIAPDTLFSIIMANIRNSAKLVDTVYKLEPLLAPDAKGRMNTAASTLAVRLGKDAVAFTSALYRTAWKLSGSVEFESWMVELMNEKKKR